MPIIHVIVVLIVIGVVIALVNKYGPPHIDGKFITLINVVAVVATVLWLLSLFVPFGNLGTIRTPR